MTGITTSAVPTTNQTAVFARLGLIVRDLHDALCELGADEALADAVCELPSARERLLHIGELTERAANTVLNKVEQVQPIQETLASDAEQLQQQWLALSASGADLPPPMQQLMMQTLSYLSQARAGHDVTHGALSDIMLSQDFQDLTGQLIKKVVSVLERTENDLLKLLIDAAPPGALSRLNKEELLAGPGAAGGIALKQDDVDDLLADLGF
ncbi:protein phosphatase CheZ [Duganella qianjiadongensis]|uniref:Protein phosphatase CheZ n=1 Tax=Duganella qianjiadongensis TaxID=2692176 RepID=A0ABW9VMV6_9BURK|nr:protein phosphatase CheZ [Duganella qianjiadongensis]MYM39774.1 protein phosphatase CheZ [Duganella qianjiadongensis]